jgi:hypothetical protein
MTTRDIFALTAAESVKRIAYDSADVVGGFQTGTYFLVVSGTAPCVNMEVSLSPLIYIDCPEYWGIEVIGTLPGGFCLTAIKPFSVSIPLAGITRSKGIEVLGATKRKDQIDVPGGCRTGEARI